MVRFPGVSLAFHYAREGRIAQEARLSAVTGLYEWPVPARPPECAQLPHGFFVLAWTSPCTERRTSIIAVSALVLILYTALPTLRPHYLVLKRHLYLCTPCRATGTHNTAGCPRGVCKFAANWYDRLPRSCRAATSRS